MVQDLVHNLCESLVENIGGVAGVGKNTPPTPITYLTQWKIVGNSEVHTLPYPDGVVLPNGYKRCKYLEFHGTEYIDTGIIPEQGISVYAKYMHTSFFGGDSGVFGCRESPWSRDSLHVFRQTSSAVYLISYGGKIADNKTASNPTIATGDNIELELDSTKCVIKVNGQAYNISNNNTITKGTKTIYLGKVNGYGALLIGKVYKFVLYGSNSLPIFNGIPCLDDNNTPCLYDTVSGTSFYNDGTGTFGYELYPQPTEIWSCGEYSAVDGKYHILVQPQGGSIADIALDEPLRMVNDVADTIEFPSDTEGKALVTRNLKQVVMSSFEWRQNTAASNTRRYLAPVSDAYPYQSSQIVLTMNTGGYANVSANDIFSHESNIRMIGMYPDIPGHYTVPNFNLYDPYFNKAEDFSAFLAYIADKLIIYRLATPTTELIDAPQIEEAESYTCVISQGAKAIEWSSFITN